MTNEQRMLTDSEALDRLRKDIIILLYNEPFYAFILSKMKKVLDDRVAVAGVSVIDGTVNLYINPKGYFQYATEERIFILIHEVMHIIFHHHSRKKKRHFGLWNVATDVAINQLIESQYAHMPADCLRIDSWEKKHGFRLPEKLHAEAYYHILVEKKEQIDLSEQMKQGPHGDHLDNQNEEQKKRPAPPSGSPGTSEEDSSPFDQLHPTWDDSTDVNEQLAEGMIRSMIQEAYKEARGTIPAKIEHQVRELIQPKIQWKRILYNFIAKRRATNKQSTWKKRNRRLGNSVMGYKKNRKLVVAVAIDTSASISEEDFNTFYTEIINIHQNGATVILMECDAKVHTITKFSKHHTPRFVGGGGTDFRPVFNAIEQKENKLLIEKPDALIFFTDGYGIAPDKPIIPTLWCLTKDGKKPLNKNREDISWGSFLHLEH